MRNNSNGSVLLSVLMLTTLFSVMGLVLLSINLNHTKQTAAKLKDMQAINASEMGLKAYNELIDQTVKEIKANPPKTTAEMISKLEDSIPASYSDDFSHLSANPGYKVTRESETHTDQSLIWKITSSGWAGDRTHSVTATRTFSFNGTSATGSSSDRTQEYMGLSLPYVHAAVHSAGPVANYGADINGDVQMNGQGPALDLTAVKKQFLAMKDVVKEPSGAMNNDYPSNVIFENSLSSDFKKDTAVFTGNVLINGNLTINLNKHGEILFKGYVFVTGTINITGQSNVTFEHTVYSQSNVYIADKPHTHVDLQQGLVSAGAVFLNAQKGELIINGQQKAAPVPGTVSIDTTIGGIDYK